MSLHSFILLATNNVEKAKVAIFGSWWAERAQG